MLKLEQGQSKLSEIIQIKKEFPDNKDIIRYHAVYLIQEQLDKECETVKQMRRDIID